MNNFTVSSPSASALFAAVEFLQERFDLVRIGYEEGPPVAFRAEFAIEGTRCGMSPKEVAQVTSQIKAKAEALKKVVHPPK